MDKENILIKDKHILICLDEQLSNYRPTYLGEINYLKKYFCGNVVTNMKSLEKFQLGSNIIMYICGNIKQNLHQIPSNQNILINIIKELSYNYDIDTYNIIKIGEVPI